jgi:RIO kinase 2
LKKNDFRILQAIETGMRTSKYVDVETIIEFSRLSTDKVVNHLDSLHYHELIQRWKGHYIGYQLTHHGYDALALWVLAQRDVVVAFGAEIGKGKESDVYQGFNDKEEKVVVKIHRVGRPSFQSSKKLRSYVGNRGHINWLYKSRLSAEREFEGLKIANVASDKTPEVIDCNRNIIVMEYFEGIDLADLIDLPHPLKIFNGIITEIEKLYRKGQIIHGDLSEYNVLITPDEDFLLIDFPQFESITHPNSEELLLRDINNICKYFKRKYQIQSDPEIILDEIING